MNMSATKITWKQVVEQIVVKPVNAILAVQEVDKRLIWFNNSPQVKILVYDKKPISLYKILKLAFLKERNGRRHQSVTVEYLRY